MPNSKLNSHPSRDFSLLLGASFISQVGGHFLTLALVASIFVRTGSLTKASLIFIFSFLPSVLAARPIGNLIDEKFGKGLYLTNEAISILVSILCGVVFALELPYPLLCLCIAFRSLFLNITKATSVKWIRTLSKPEQLAPRFKINALIFFLSTALSGVLAGALLKGSSMKLIVLLDISTYLFGMLLITLTNDPKAASLPQKSEADTSSMTKFDFLAHPGLKLGFLMVCLSQAFFQGAYQALVTYLPMEHYNLGIEGTGFYQIAASVGIILGFIANWKYPESLKTPREGGFPSLAIGLFILGFLTLGATQVSSHVGLSLIAFLLLNALYELIWLHFNADFFRLCPNQHVGRYQFTLQVVAASLMSLATLVYSLLLQFAGSEKATIIYIVLTSISFLALKSKGHYASDTLSRA